MESISFVIVIGIIAQTVALLTGGYKFVLSREEKMRAEMCKMHEQQDARIEKAEDEAKGIRNNYNTKFERVHDAMHLTELKLLESLTTMETNLRTSHHTLSENVTKALNHLELLLTKK